MEISKALTADMDGDAIGGSVNLITKTADFREMKVSASVAGEYNDLMGKLGSQNAFSISQRLGKDGKFGYLFNANYNASRRGSDKIEPSSWDDNTLEEMELRDYQINRDRVGF